MACSQSRLKYNLNCHKSQKMSAPKASSSIVRLPTAAISAIAEVEGYTAISSTLSALASVNSSAAGSTFTAIQGDLRVVNAGTIKASAGTVVSSALAPAQGSVKVAASGSALASAGTVASSVLTASQRNTLQGVVVATGCVLVAGSAVIASGGFAEVAFTASMLVLIVLTIILAFATYQDSAAAATAGNTSAYAGAVLTSAVIAEKGSTVSAAKEDNTEAVAAGNDLASAGTIAGSAISGTPAYIAAKKHNSSAGYANTAAFLQSAAEKGISASTKVILLMPEKAALDAGVAVAGEIVVLSSAGFRKNGIEDESAAAAVQSNIGNVRKGSIFELLQSEGAKQSYSGEAIAVIL
ncbi:hypothetical protein JTE90_015609 [Oedothorax gibbosus]|uniref:Uncharacterized protein n=1 Tax=Oedothorax gibbosus TaxID=931172 RepID=A0AAV6UU57_9ARAC|nr:hypothetical protein JTE90_015609 [Oedothorax gibbosus]